MNSAKKEIFYIEPIKFEETAKVRVAGYARVSSDSDDQLNSFSAQLIYYRNLISENENWNMVDIYADEGTSGVSVEKRDEFNRMINDCREGKIDRIITKSISRFGRNTVDNIRVMRELQSLGVSIFFEQEGIDSATISSENMITLHSIFAQNESISISQNCKKGNRMRMARGNYIASNAPYSYRLVDKQLEIFESEAVVVRDIFKNYLSGKGVHEIARNLNENYVERKNDGSVWWVSTINKIIRNERYSGNSLFQKSFNDDVIPYTNRLNKGELPQYFVKDTHDRIVDEVSFNLANILINKRANPRSCNMLMTLLTQKISCKSCGRIYKRKEIRSVTYWVCNKHDAKASDCTSERIPEENIHLAFTRMYNKLRKNREKIIVPLLTQLETLREKNYRGSANLTDINKQIAQVAEQNHVMTGLVSKGILDSAIFISQSNEIKFKLQKLKEQKSMMLKSVKKDELLEKLEELDEILQTSPEFITEMNEGLFEEIVEKIEAYDNQNIDFILLGGLKLTERL